MSFVEWVEAFFAPEVDMPELSKEFRSWPSEYLVKVAVFNSLLTSMVKDELDERERVFFSLIEEWKDEL